MNPAAYAAGRAVVVAENGECVRASLTWCEHHESRVRKGMLICDAFLDLLGLMEEVVDAVEPVFRADERENPSAEVYARAWDEVSAEAWDKAKRFDRLQVQMEELLAVAKVERDAAPKADMLNDPYLYGQAMWYGGRVVGIVEALTLLSDEPDE